jgi:hypothetical protein
MNADLAQIRIGLKAVIRVYPGESAAKSDPLTLDPADTAD